MDLSLLQVMFALIAGKSTVKTSLVDHKPGPPTVTSDLSDTARVPYSPVRPWRDVIEVALWDCSPTVSISLLAHQCLNR